MPPEFQNGTAKTVNEKKAVRRGKSFNGYKNGNTS